MLLTQLVLVFLALVASCLCAYEFRLRRRQQLKGPKRQFLVGSYYEAARNFGVLHDWLLSYFSDECKTIRVDWGVFYEISTVDPANVEHILKGNFANYFKGNLTRERNYELIGKGIFGANDELWKRHRKISSYEFSSRKLHVYSVQVFKKHATRLMEVLDAFASEHKSLDFQDVCLRMTLDSIGEIGFGMNLGTLSPKLPSVPFAVSFDRLSELLMRRTIGPIWKWKKALGVGSEKEIPKHVQVIDAFTTNIIQMRRKEIEERRKDGKELDREDLLSRFMDSDLYTGSELRDSVINFLLAGRDTTASTLSWFMLCICKNPRVVDCILAEMKRVIAEDNSSITFEHFAELLNIEAVSKLHYLRAAITETLRLYPPVPRNAKCARNDDTLPDGTEVKKGDLVSYIPYSMGRMRFLWGDDALEFKPERWLKNSVFQAESPFKYTTFQAGPRVCLGKDFAYMQLMVTAAMLLRFFRFELVEGQVIHYRLLLVMAMLHGIRVQVYRRE